MTPPDPISEIVALLKADDGVAALAGSHVYGGGLPTGGLSMPQAAVVVSPAGGVGRRAFLPYRNTRIDTTCYGATLHESWQVHLAVREVLENMRRNGSLFSASISSDGSNAVDPAELWPICYASYVVMSAIST